MTLSHVLWWNNDGIGKRVSWKVAALIAIPTCIIGAAGVAYYISHRSPVKINNNNEDAPKTPLELTVSLKNRGNKFFKAGQYFKAVQLYNEGLELCPVDSTSERAILYQNRAAAKENLQQYDSAVSDCTLALEQSPRYLKALNRRARLYEKLEEWDNCLADVIACCILEEFTINDNIMFMDQILKKVGQMKAKQEWDTLPHSLPSVAFIHNYLSAFAWNPFEVTHSSTNGQAQSDDSDGVDADESTSKQHTVPDLFRSAYDTLNKALALIVPEDFEQSMSLAHQASTMFETALAKVSPSDVHRNMADGDESTVNNIDITNPKPVSFLENGHEQTETTMTSVPISPDQIAQAKAAWQKALLLHATYLALAGRASEAKQLFQSVSADDSGAEPIVRVNALIKLACLSMSVDQNFASCLYNFQTAQNVCPECPDVYLHRGQINLLANQLDEALHDLKMAVDLKPEFSVAQAQHLYTLYRKTVNNFGLERGAIHLEDFSRLAQKYPTCLETHSLFAQVLTEQQKFEASDVEFAKVIELAPNSGLAYAHRGLLHLNSSDDFEAAYKWFMLGAKADPKCEMIHELLGQVYVNRGDFQNALKHFDIAIQESKTQTDLAHMIALREAVRAQSNVCQKYGISALDVVKYLMRQQQRITAGLRE